MNKLRKKQINVAATAFIALMGGLTIWSCSQDELDDFGEPIYRYTAEEIATLNSLADEYGLANVHFKTQSDTPLLPVDDMKDIFKDFALIQASLSAPLMITDSTENSISYRSSEKPFKRLKGISETITEERKIQYGTLIWDIYWQQSIDSNGYFQSPSVNASAHIVFSSDFQREGYYTAEHRNFITIRGTELYIEFDCKIGNMHGAYFDFSFSDWVHPGFRPYQ